jgi:outer membrane protein assembly factor BamB/orotate phosphoribosyltransferase
MEQKIQELRSYILKKCILFGIDNPDLSFKHLKSAIYLFDLRELILHPKYGTIVAELIWARIKTYEPRCIFGSGVGSIPLMTLIQQVAYKEGIDLNILVCRDKRKNNNRERIVEGIRVEGSPRAFFVDDLTNSGNTYRHCLWALKQDKVSLRIIGATGILDFWTFKGTRALESQGKRIEYIFRRHDLGLTRADPKLPLLGPLLHEILTCNVSDDLDLKSPAVWDEERVYWATDQHKIYCYSTETKSLIWQYQAPITEDSVSKGIVNKMALDSVAIYVNTYNGFSCKLDKHTGKVMWIAKPGRWLHSSPTISEDNSKVYLSTESRNFSDNSPEGDFVCLDSSTGQEIWRVETKELAPCTPYFYKNKIYVGNNLKELYCIDANTGQVIWKQKLLGCVKGRVAISDSYLCATTELGMTHILDSNTGDILHSKIMANAIRHNFTEVIDGNFVIIDSDGLIKLVDNNLNIIWITRARGKLFWYPTITNTSIIVTTRTGHCLELDKHTGRKLKSSMLTDMHSPVLLGTPGSVNKDNSMIAFHTINKGLLIYAISN